MDTTRKYWNSNKARIYVKKDGHDLVYTGTIISIDSLGITFLDREGIVYFFKVDQLQQIKEISKGDSNGNRN